MKRRLNELVARHRLIKDEPIGAALWLKTRMPGVWLLETMESMPPDPHHADEPLEVIESYAGKPYTLSLLLAREKDVHSTILRNVDFAIAVAESEVLPDGEERGSRLRDFARLLLKGQPA